MCEPSASISSLKTTLSQHHDEPVFAEAWQARAFALALKLSERGHFTQSEWTMALARQLREVAERGEADDGSHYYDHWLAALEALVIEKAMATRVSLETRKEEWRDAYLRTPHGRPVELRAKSRATLDDGHDPAAARTPADDRLTVVLDGKVGR
jgi:nitrile hydratase accessory protein